MLWQEHGQHRTFQGNVAACLLFAAGCCACVNTQCVHHHMSAREPHPRLPARPPACLPACRCMLKARMSAPRRSTASSAATKTRWSVRSALARTPAQEQGAVNRAVAVPWQCIADQEVSRRRPAGEHGPMPHVLLLMLRGLRGPAGVSARCVRAADGAGACLSQGGGSIGPRLELGARGVCAR